jgi:hypothetical protein
MTLSTATAPTPDSWKAAAIRLRLSHPALAPGAALSLSTLGWSLMWAQALDIVRIVPQWLCILCFFAGLALIPYCTTRSRLRAEPQ